MSLTKPRHQATQESYEATRLSNLNFRLKFTVTFLFRHSVQVRNQEVTSALRSILCLRSSVPDIDFKALHGDTSME